MTRVLILTLSLSLLIACNNDKAKADAGDSLKNLPDTVTGKSAADTANISSPTTATGNNAGSSRGANPGNEKDEILMNIDQYLISKPSAATGVLSLENKLLSATINKAYAEVTASDASGKVLRTDFLVFDNIAPGDSKSLRLPSGTNAVTINSHIVRLKSDELTNGETIMVGSRYTPK